MGYVVTNPIEEDISFRSESFDEVWEWIGREVKQSLDDGPKDTTWVNIMGTHIGDTMKDHVVSRTIAPEKAK